MAQIVIRKLDDAVIERLRRRAKTKGHSLESELRGVITRAAMMTTAEKLDVVDAIRTRSKAVARPPAEDLIRRDRDEE